jgi:hypothetical protein
MNPTIMLVHINEIFSGDTIIHEDVMKTVSNNNIKHGFCGKTLFGDSYKMGTIKVKKCIFIKM